MNSLGLYIYTLLTVNAREPYDTNNEPIIPIMHRLARDDASSIHTIYLRTIYLITVTI